MPSPRPPRLIENFDRLSVERAIAELRAGRPVLLIDGDRSGLVASADSADLRMLSALSTLAEGKAHLVLTEKRLARLGVQRETAGALALPRLDAERILALSTKPDARIDAPVGATTIIDRAGLDLAGLALLLPAVIVIPLTSERLAGESILSVRAEAIEHYRKQAATKLTLVSRAPVPLEGAEQSEFIVFRGGEGLRDQVAVKVGTPDANTPVLVRLHSACLTGDLFGSLKCDCGDQLREAVRMMAAQGGGYLLYLDQEGRGAGLANKIRAYKLQDEGLDTYDADAELGLGMDQRHFDFAAAMLEALGVNTITLITNNPDKIDAMKRAGIDVVGHRRLFGRENPSNLRYVATKRERAGHLSE
ncbi:MAG: GTP cyclohydrolase II RibA [Alphaproteobacteria bacterium]